MLQVFWNKTMQLMVLGSVPPCLPHRSPASELSECLLKTQDYHASQADLVTIWHL